jgi:hypothetical protein
VQIDEQRGLANDGLRGHHEHALHSAGIAVRSRLLDEGDAR